LAAGGGRPCWTSKDILREEERAVTESDAYLLGRGESEQTRLSRQISELAPDSDALLGEIGIRPGERVIDIGCGPGGVLELLARRVGPSGSVLGLERSPHFVEMARRFIDDKSLAQVEVREGDAYDTGLPRASFDGAHMRLVLVNVPEPERIVREMVSLVRPGGWVASFEADWMAHVCDPPLPAWTRLVDAFAAYSASLGGDLLVGRRAHRLFRDAGVVDIQVDAVVHVYPFGHNRQSILRDFINNVREPLIEGGFLSRSDLESDMADLERHLARPQTLVTSHMYYRLRGRVPQVG
jgi:SAM-dependent methyltransferase